MIMSRRAIKLRSVILPQAKNSVTQGDLLRFYKEA